MNMELRMTVENLSSKSIPFLANTCIEEKSEWGTTYSSPTCFLVAGCPLRRVLFGHLLPPCY